MGRCRHLPIFFLLNPNLGSKVYHMDMKIRTALVSVYNKDGLDEIVLELHKLGVRIYSTGGTRDYIEALGIAVEKVEDLTGYPSILDGRVKTLHPKVFGGILAIRNEDHLGQLVRYEIPPIDLVVVDLYPFEKTVAGTDDMAQIIEKIDIGGISLIRAAAKNFNDVVVIPSMKSYPDLIRILQEQEGVTNLDQRKRLAAEAFEVSSHYDTHIFTFLSATDQKQAVFKVSEQHREQLRYGENPHQSGSFYGDLDKIFEKKCGKELSYNNLVDIDAALQLMDEFRSEGPTFAILKHTNPCGVATRNTTLEAWNAALAADPVSAFGGILISNAEIDLGAATEIDRIFYEVLIAPAYTDEALDLLMQKPKRILLRLKDFCISGTSFKSLLGGVIAQDSDVSHGKDEPMEIKTRVFPTSEQKADLVFAMKCAKHLKSNTIVLARDRQMLGMGCGQTSRIDACRQAIEKAKQYGFALEGGVMASDAFFPFPDCVELVCHEGIKAVIQPGGSIKDQLSIDFCDANGIAMAFTGIRHFRH